MSSRETHREETQHILSNTRAESSAGLRIVTNRSELVTLQLPPTGRFDDAVRHDSTEDLSKSILIGRSRIPWATAATVQILEKELAFYLHVEHPKSPSGAPPEKRLQGEQPIPTQALGMDGGGLAIQRTSSIGVRNRKKLCVGMWV